MQAPVNVAAIVCAGLAVALAVAAWKFPRLRVALLAAAASVGGVAALLVALGGARGDLGRAKRSVAAKRQIKTAVKDHKRALIAEQKRMAEVQDKIDAITEPPEPEAKLDLDALADRINKR
tara:strand:+ start:1502 stop:1864 length:363 start_codon:yes stop_codon:yes gene_type:complete